MSKARVSRIRHRGTLRRGFTLIELMIVVAILGILAAIAIPAFVTYVRRSKTSEASETLKALFNGASAYYLRDMVGSGLNGAGLWNCTVPAESLGINPGPSKQTPSGTYTSFPALGFHLNNAYYYEYEIAGSAGGCGLPPPANGIRYTMRATGDLDGDATQSTFELAIGITSEGELYQSSGVYVVNETE